MVFEKKLEVDLNLMMALSSEKKHEFITSDHIFLALIRSKEIIEMLEEFQCDYLTLSENIESFIDLSTSLIPEGSNRKTMSTAGFHRVIQRAMDHCNKNSIANVNSLELLSSLLLEEDSQSAYILSDFGINKEEVINYISTNKQAKDSPLKKYTVNLNLKAKNGNIDILVGRVNEVESVIQTLCRRRKNNPLLVGEAGVGKTAIAEGLALKIYNKETPSVLYNSVVYSLDLAALIAGTKYRGEFEKRLKELLSEIKENPHVILFVDEIHTIIGAGSSSGAMDVSNLIKPALSSGELRCFGATTYKEYRGLFEKDTALSRRFQKVNVVEPTVLETIKILKGLRPTFEKHHNIKYTDESLRLASELSDRYINDRFLPDKAIDIIDEAGAKQRLSDKPKKTIRAKQIEEVVAKIARIPEKSISDSDNDKLKSLSFNMKSTVLVKMRLLTNYLLLFNYPGQG